MRKFNANVIVTQQQPEDWDVVVAKRNRNAGFEDWRQKLQHGSRLPRGRYFVGKKPGPQKMMVMDERWMLDKDAAKTVIKNANTKLIVDSEE